MNAAATDGRFSAGAGMAIGQLSNDDLIIRLKNTPNHLSRWLTPIHDLSILENVSRRGEPSVKDVLIAMRDTEARAYSLMHAIATQVNPDLDRVPRIERTEAQIASDRASNALVIMSGFRRVRESTTSLLRALPDAAWERGGYSRAERSWTIRELAEFLAESDREKLAEIDRILEQRGAREGIAAVSRVDLASITVPFPPTTRRG
ncbi:MAG: hypothetical protein IT338_04090 [Thermomicrobiales bacterium]|nr:hypothetical protein [Thermomicrobiales bacterium]